MLTKEYLQLQLKDIELLKDDETGTRMFYDRAIEEVYSDTTPEIRESFRQGVEWLLKDLIRQMEVKK